MSSDIEILTRAYEIETKKGIQGKTQFHPCAWESFQVGATRSDLHRLKTQEMIVVSSRLNAGQFSQVKYRLTEKGIKVVNKYLTENEPVKVSAADVMDAMSLIIGYNDVKEKVARAVEARRKAHFLLEGPPAGAKSLFLEAVRNAVPDAYLAFGSRTSGAGLSDELFLHKPSVLLLDEADKMDKETLAVLLGVLESGEIIETKSKKTRGVKLNTQILAACNSSAKFTPEFKSRYAMHLHFPEYTREEFIEVAIGFLTRVENTPPEVARLIGEKVYDYRLGDIRKARGIWLLMDDPTEDEVEKVIEFSIKYSEEFQAKTRKKESIRSQARFI